MLELAEKITHGFCLFIVLVVGALYLLEGVGTTVPPEFVPSVRATVVPDSSRAPAQSLPERTRALVEEVQSIDENQIRQKLQAQGVRASGAPLQKRILSIPPSTFEIIQAEPNWSKQLNLIGSVPLTGAGNQKSRLKITKMHDHSLLKKMGFEPGDVIELLDGEIVEFNEYSTLRYRSMFKDALERVRQGESVSVTITREGQPVHLVFSL